MIRDSEFSEEAISKFVRTDSVGRNGYLSNILGALNSIEKSTYISIDAGWGAGKTVFMKEIEYLNYCALDMFSAPGLSLELLTTFQDKYVVFYYNAWENDYHSDPLQSLLFSLIDKLYTDDARKDKVKILAKSAVKNIAKSTVKSLTHNIVDIDKINEAETVDGLVSSITVVNERKNAVTDIINEILPSGKKLLFIVDELDRCKPEFAVNLMEVMKHYYSDNNLVFLLSTNNRQLVHTVKKYYGDGFDGYGYLDKLYDLILELPPVDIEKYSYSQLGVPNNSYWINIAQIEITKFLKMSMREANRYNSLLSITRVRLGNSDRGLRNTVLLMTYYVFIPLALGLKIRDIKLYDKFVSGNGEELIKNLFKFNETFHHVRVRDENPEQDAIQVAVEAYRSMINAKSIPYDQSNYDTRRAEEIFTEILPLISSLGRIDGAEELQN